MLGQMTTDLGPKLLPHLPRLLQIVINLRIVCTQLLDARDKVGVVVGVALLAIGGFACVQLYVTIGSVVNAIFHLSSYFVMHK